MSSTAVTDEASSAPQEMKLLVQGMTCAACAARVEKKLNTIDGVAATVNFATEAAIVTAPAEVPVQRLIDAVEQAGYRAEILERRTGGASAGGPQEPAERDGDADVVAYLLLHVSGGGIYLEAAAWVTTFLLAGRLYEAKALRNFGAPATKRPDWSRPHPARAQNASATEPNGPADDSPMTGSLEQAV